MEPVPIWEKYALSIDEASSYFHIGSKKLREIVQNDQDADYIFWSGDRPRIKRVLFEEYLNSCNVI